MKHVVMKHTLRFDSKLKNESEFGETDYQLDENWSEFCTRKAGKVSESSREHTLAQQLVAEKLFIFRLHVDPTTRKISHTMRAGWGGRTLQLIGVTEDEENRHIVIQAVEAIR